MVSGSSEGLASTQADCLHFLARIAHSLSIICANTCPSGFALRLLPNRSFRKPPYSAFVRIQGKAALAYDRFVTFLDSRCNHAWPPISLFAGRLLTLLNRTRDSLISIFSPA